MDTLELPNGLTVAEVKSEKLFTEKNHLEYLEFTQRKLDQITIEVYSNIIEAIGQNRAVNLIVPLNGGLIFYRKLMSLFEENALYANAINVIFCDEDSSDVLSFSDQPQDVENAYNLVIDDIWDKGGTGSEIIEALREYGSIGTLDYFAFCKKESSPETNNGARVANTNSIATFLDEWLHGWGGMNSGKFATSPDAAMITALERTSFLPLIPTTDNIGFDVNDEESVEKYMDLLTQTNLAVCGILPIEVYYDVLYLEQNPALPARFEYLANIHKRFLKIDEV